jgi:hypothetical protein
MSRRQCGGLIEEEQLGVAVGLHHGQAVSALELEHAGDPLPAGPAPAAERAVGQMKGASAIAHHQAALRRGDNVAGGGDTVLERHAVIWQNSKQQGDRECRIAACK